MTIVSDWQSNILYPGGQGKCKVGTADLFPDRDWYVNVSIRDLHKWMWNLEDWSSNFDITLIDSQEAGAHTIDIDWSMSGQNHYADVNGEVGTDNWDATGRILFTPPNNRVCGGYNQTFHDPSIPSTINSSSSEERLLPYASGNFLFDSETYPRTISGTLALSGSGDVTFSVIGDGLTVGFVPSLFFDAEIDFYYVRLLGNGTADVYFDLTVVGDNSTAYAYTLTEASSGDIPPGGSASFLTVSTETLSILGKNITGYISVYDELESVTPAAVDTFTLTYAIDTTTAYTYA